MGLIGDNCRPCRDAAKAQDGHGGDLAGSWWRAWAKVRLDAVSNNIIPDDNCVGK